MHTHGKYNIIHNFSLIKKEKILFLFMGRLLVIEVMAWYAD